MSDISFTILKIIISAFASICGVLFITYVAPLLRALMENARYLLIMTTVTSAVKAAEETVKGTGMGSVKKERVMQNAAEWLNNKGITITESQLSELVQGAVYDMHQAQEAVK